MVDDDIVSITTTCRESVRLETASLEFPSVSGANADVMDNHIMRLY